MIPLDSIKPREGSVDSGNSSSHSSSLGSNAIDHRGVLLHSSSGPNELVFASIASYDMNAAPIRPPSSNASHHLGGIGGGGGGSRSSYAPSVIGSSSASASSGSSLGSPAGEMQPLAAEESQERGRARGEWAGGAEKGAGPTIVFGTATGEEEEANAGNGEEDVATGGAADDEPDTPLFASILRPPSSAEVY